MIGTEDLRLLVKIAELGSVAGAARQLGLLPATAGAALQRIERTLGARLFERSTRSVRLTDAGQSYLRTARQALELLTEAAERLAGDRTELAGAIRLAAPSDLGRTVVRPWLDEFQQQHPAIRVTLLLGDHLTDLLRDDADCALRYGQLADSALIRRRLAPSHRLLVAAPAYLDRYGQPGQPHDLADHRCLLMLRGLAPVKRWHLSQGATTVQVAVDGDRASDDGAVVRDWAIAGHGIALKSWLDVAADVALGRLVPVLPDWSGGDAPLHLLFATNRHRPVRLDRLAALLASRFAALTRDFPPPPLSGKAADDHRD